MYIPYPSDDIDRFASKCEYDHFFSYFIFPQTIICIFCPKRGQCRDLDSPCDLHLRIFILNLIKYEKYDLHQTIIF